MKYHAKIEISLKAGLFDPEGEATKKSLLGLKFSVESVRSSRIFQITLNANSKNEAENMLEDMCKKLLSNPNKDDYKFTIEEEYG